MPDYPHVTLPQGPVVVELDLRINFEMTDRIGGDIGRGGNADHADVRGAFPNQQTATFLGIRGLRLRNDQRGVARIDNDSRGDHDRRRA